MSSSTMTSLHCEQEQKAAPSSMASVGDDASGSSSSNTSTDNMGCGGSSRAASDSVSDAGSWVHCDPILGYPQWGSIDGLEYVTLGFPWGSSHTDDSLGTQDEEEHRIEAEAPAELREITTTPTLASRHLDNAGKSEVSDSLKKSTIISL